MQPEDLAAAMCFMAQKERPFPDGKEPERQQRQRRDERDDRGRDDRRGGERGERAPRRDRREDNEGMVRYRVEVGREQGVNPGDLVGAIANESKISGKNIGHIRLFDNCSSIYLPEGMDEPTISSLKQVKVRNKPLEMTIWVDDGTARDTAREERPRRRRDGEFRRDRDRRSSNPSSAPRKPRNREERS